VTWFSQPQLRLGSALLPPHLLVGHQIFKACGAAPILGWPAAQKTESRASRSGTTPSFRRRVIWFSQPISPRLGSALSLSLSAPRRPPKFLGLRRSTHFGLACGAEGRKQSTSRSGTALSLLQGAGDLVLPAPAPAWLCSLAPPLSSSSATKFSRPAAQHPFCILGWPAAQKTTQWLSSTGLSVL
jgi:hypothetical protein